MRSPMSPAGVQPLSPTKAGFNISQMLLSSTLQLPANAPSTPRGAGKGSSRLLTTRDPLSIPITTVNFRRFVAKSGPLFWLQDRLEEIVMWRKGWKYTVVWMAAYAFLCYFPRMILLIPHAVTLGILLATHPSLRRRATPDSLEDLSINSVQPPPQTQPGEGSVDWLANVQAIQNLMGAVSDVHDFVLPLVPHLTHSSPYTAIILTFTVVSFLLLIPLVNLLPLRTTFLVLGLFPFLLTHPFTLFTLFPTFLATIQPLLRPFRTRLHRIIDDDKLEDKHWRTEMREVELWENERWSATAGAGDEAARAEGNWSKLSLKPSERRPWTRGRDGWSGIADDGGGDVSSNLTFSLAAGWCFVETEDWRPDLEGTWLAAVGADEDGWVYTNDAWLDSHPAPLEEWKTVGMTRRRRWVRRIYYNAKLGRNFGLQGNVNHSTRGSNSAALELCSSEWWQCTARWRNTSIALATHAVSQASQAVQAPAYYPLEFAYAASRTANLLTCQIRTNLPCAGARRSATLCKVKVLALNVVYSRAVPAQTNVVPGKPRQHAHPPSEDKPWKHG
ncbi:Peroxisomal membrane protein PEX29 [Grifola frondosa]|uniref:Peroxisomal membrane protein PEX29 n=1 Tax=Grifola frondosa TaxID=5627 RepID=A0A1C7M1C5_GRIFR|nr:Peroxisomal membrane protein PEX29 [Grifola frondosa]